MKPQQKGCAASLLVPRANRRVHHDQLAGLESRSVRWDGDEARNARRTWNKGQRVEVATGVAVLEDIVAVADDAGLKGPDEGSSERKRQ